MGSYPFQGPGATLILRCSRPEVLAEAAGALRRALDALGVPYRETAPGAGA
jgi:hypothetical protein